MPILEKHIIHKVTVEVFTHSMKSGEHLRDNLDAFLKKEVFPFIENYMERYEGQFASRSLIMDSVSLDIQVDAIASNQWDKVMFLHHVSEQLDSSFEEVFLTPKPGKISTKTFFKDDDKDAYKSEGNVLERDMTRPNYRWLPSDEKSFLSWLYFLEQGELPWWGYSELEIRKLEEKTVKAWKVLPDFQKKLMDRLVSNQVRERLYLQYTPEEIIRIISHLPSRISLSQEVVNRVAGYMRKGSFAEARLMAWVLMELAVNEADVNEFYNPNNSVDLEFFRPTFRSEIIEKNMDEFVKLIQRFISEKHRKNLDFLLQRIKKSIKPTDEFWIKRSESPTKFHEFPKGDIAASESEKTGKQPTIPQSVFLPEASEIAVEEKVLANAGIILLHPFLGAFFTDCGVLTGDNRFLDPELAVHLLHYAATGETQAPDYELQFEKMLIGLPAGRTLDRFIPITQWHMGKVKELLDSLLENWPKIKNTSADTVRVEFLQRNGKIQWEGDTLRITMDRKVQDILLDGLPFNLGMVKLPWRRELIIVEW